jgi:hypothetical protein
MNSESVKMEGGESNWDLKTVQKVVATSQANLANNSSGFYTSSNQFGQSCYIYN